MLGREEGKSHPLNNPPSREAGNQREEQKPARAQGRIPSLRHLSTEPCGSAVSPREASHSKVSVDRRGKEVPQGHTVRIPSCARGLQ